MWSALAVRLKAKGLTDAFDGCLMFGGIRQIDLHGANFIGNAKVGAVLAACAKILGEQVEPPASTPARPDLGRRLHRRLPPHVAAGHQADGAAGEPGLQGRTVAAARIVLARGQRPAVGEGVVEAAVAR